jgi:hypothetical protein
MLTGGLTHRTRSARMVRETVPRGSWFRIDRAQPAVAVGTACEHGPLAHRLACSRLMIPFNGAFPEGPRPSVGHRTNVRSDRRCAKAPISDLLGERGSGSAWTATRTSTQSKLPASTGGCFIGWHVAYLVHRSARLSALRTSLIGASRHFFVSCKGADPPTAPALTELTARMSSAQ